MWVISKKKSTKTEIIFLNLTLLMLTCETSPVTTACHGHTPVWNRNHCWMNLYHNDSALSVTSWQRCWNAGWMMIPAFSPPCRGAGRSGSCVKRYSNYSAWHTTLKWEQTAFCKRLRVMRTAKESVQYRTVHCAVMLPTNTQKYHLILCYMSRAAD